MLVVTDVAEFHVVIESRREHRSWLLTPAGSVIAVMALLIIGLLWYMYLTQTPDVPHPRRENWLFGFTPVLVYFLFRESRLPGERFELLGFQLSHRRGGPGSSIVADQATYDMLQMTNLRLRGGLVEFEYGGRTRRFGDTLTQGEQSELIDLMLDHARAMRRSVGLDPDLGLAEAPA